MDGTVYVDADACPVKEEVIRVASRHGRPVVLVSNQWLRLRSHPLVRLELVPEGPDAADDWIAAHIGPRDVAITADIPLAARCLEQQAQVIAPDGRVFDTNSIGMALSMRDLNSHLRDMGEISGYNAGFSKKDRERFLNTLEHILRSLARET